MSLPYRRARGIFFSTLLSSRNPLLPARTLVSAAVEPCSRIAGVAPESELRKMIDKFKLRCTDAAFRKKKFAYVNIVQRLIIAKKISLIEEILQDQKQYITIDATEYFVEKIISLYGNAGMIDHARKLFDEMPQLGHKQSVTSFTALLKAYVCSGHQDKVETIFREIPPKLSITPNYDSYFILMKAYSKMGSPDSILSTITELREKGMEPTSSAYALLFDGLYKNSRVKEVENIWNLMKSSNISPCIECYNSKLNFLASNKKMEEALELFKILETKGPKPVDLTFCALFEGFRAMNNLQEIKRWLKKMPYKTMYKNNSNYIFEIIVPFATKMGDFGFATEVCREAIFGKICLEEATLQGVLDGLVSQSKVEKARRLLVSFQQFSGIYTSCEVKKMPGAVVK